MKNILWFKELGIKDIPKVGGKNASLGEMYQKLTRLRPSQARGYGGRAKKGMLVPNGFAVTAGAYHQFLKQTGIDKKIKKILTGLDTHNIRDLVKRGQEVRQTILQAEFPENLKISAISCSGLLL